MTSRPARLVDGLTPPLEGRLEPPQRTFDAVPRPRLLQRLITSPAGGVTLITASAGYGKSTLLGQFVAQESRPVAWLSLNGRDDDAVVLLGDLAHACGRAARPGDDVRQRPETDALAVIPLALPRLISWLREQHEPLVIVLDDVHCVQSRDALDVLRALCDDALPAVSIVLSGRAAPRLPLSRMRAEGRLWELTASDLRMTVAEGVAMLHAAGAHIDGREAADVVRRTEGWPAALYLASLMLREPSGAGVDVPFGPDDPNFTAYVRDEVLASVDADDAAFLIRTSILDELRPDICDAVLQRTDSQARLQALAEANVFVTSFDARRHGYRVHGLFRELLQSELRLHRMRERELHRRACEVYCQQEDWERAVWHAVAANDSGRAADLIWQLTPVHVSRGETDTIKRWVSWLNDAEVVAHPLAAVALEDGDADMAAHCAAMAVGEHAERTTVDGESVYALALLLRAGVGAAGLAQAADDAAGADAALTADSPMRSVASLIMGSRAMLDGDASHARALLSRTERQAVGRVTTAYALALAQQALLAIEDDRWDEADALVHRAWLFQRKAGLGDYSSQALVSAVRALVLAHGQAATDAREEADHAARTLALRAVVPWLALETRLVLARARAQLGDVRHARTLLQESRPLTGQDGHPLLHAWATDVETAVERLGRDGVAGVVLTTAELRTLQYMPTHLTYNEIGERLYVTRNTAKTHAMSVYRKLGATTRAQAVARGRELGLLDP